MSPISTFDVDGEVLPVPEDVAPLFQPIKLGKYELTNRIAYPPLTRCRALNNIPSPMAAVYYAQRAVKGSLLITEGTIVNETGFGYPCTPGIFTKEQIEGWKPVVQAVKAKGAIFFCQIWHTGRGSHNDYQPGGAAPISASEVAAKGQCYTMQSGMVDHPKPRQATVEEIQALVNDFRQAARNAIDAGFDGVEIHGANGYLIDQFIRDGSNKRTDQYGGCIENRCRFALEVARAVVDEIGADRVGMRFSPFGTFLDMSESTPYATFTYLVEQLSRMGLAYVHMIEPRFADNENITDTRDSLDPFRKVFKGVFIAAGGFKPADGCQKVKEGGADIVAFGRWFIATPDFHKRLLLGKPLNKYDRNTFYTQGAEGYTDYPTLEEAKPEQLAA